jgi:hypothetical protein
MRRNEYAESNDDVEHRYVRPMDSLTGSRNDHMGAKSGKPVTLTPGQTFYEGPTDIHTIGRNASKTKPAKFMVFLLKDKDAPVVIPVK